jgi:hypothetical protein
MRMEKMVAALAEIIVQDANGDLKLELILTRAMCRDLLNLVRKKSKEKQDDRACSIRCGMQGAGGSETG